MDCPEGSGHLNCKTGSSPVSCRAHHADPPGLPWRAYVYGRTRDEQCLGLDGALRKRRRALPRDQWEVLIPDHHPGFMDWDTYLANQVRIGSNIRPQASRPGTGAVREGSALLQGLATCGACGPQAGHLLPRPGQDRAELLLPGLC